MAQAIWNESKTISHSSMNYDLFFANTLWIDKLREQVPFFSRINSAIFSLEVKRDGLSLSTSNGALHLWLSSTSNADGNNICSIYGRENYVVGTNFSTFSGKDIKDYVYSKSKNAGEANGWGAVIMSASAGVIRKWEVKNPKIIWDYTPPICRVHTSVVADGVTGTCGSVSGGGTFEVGVADKTVTLVATPSSGYRFTHWGDGSKVAGYEPTINVIISQNDISAFETDKSYTAFFEKITYTIGVSAENGGTVSGGGAYEHGSNITLKAVPSAGYKFVKWSDGVTSASRSVTVTGDASYTAIFSPICVLYDNIFNFYRWVERGITSGRGTISNINDLGFTFTASVDDGYTGYSHMFAVEPGKKYTLEYDCAGGASNQTFVFFHSANGDYNWTKLADSALKKWSFTVPDGFYLASIRVDVNNKGETINYSNFRIYPADCDYMGNTLKAVDRFDSAKWSMPTPTRDCYIFQGWNTKADGSGKFYTQSDAYPTEDLILYSIWKADPPKISDVQLLYGGKVVSGSNKVPAGQSFILKCKLS